MVAPFRLCSAAVTSQRRGHLLYMGQPTPTLTLVGCVHLALPVSCGSRCGQPRGYSPRSPANAEGAEMAGDPGRSTLRRVLRSRRAGWTLAAVLAVLGILL